MQVIELKLSRPPTASDVRAATTHLELLAHDAVLALQPQGSLPVRALLLAGVVAGTTCQGREAFQASTATMHHVRSKIRCCASSPLGAEPLLVLLLEVLYLAVCVLLHLVLHLGCGTALMHQQLRYRIGFTVWIGNRSNGWGWF